MLLSNNITEKIGIVIEKEDYRIEVVLLQGDYTHSVAKDNAILYNQVYLYPEGKSIEEAVYILEAPSMMDAAEAVSFHILLELRKEEGKTILSVRLDQECLASPERQCPVQIGPLGNTESVSYNDRGDVTNETSADGGVTAYMLDGIGSIKFITCAMGNKTSFAYNTMYNLTKGKDAEGNTIAYAYDKNYNEIKEIDADGNLTKNVIRPTVRCL